MGDLHRTDLLAKVHPALAAFARLVAASSPRDWQVITGARLLADVEAKWAEGRTTPGPHAGEPGFPPLGRTVTEVRTLEKAPHAIRRTPEGLYACAVDLQFFDQRCHLDDGRTREGQAVYRWMGELAEAEGLVWGGRFPKVDQAHVELAEWRAFPLPAPAGIS